MPSEANILWARHVAGATGGQPLVANYMDESETTSIDVLTVEVDGGKVCASIGLMDSDHTPRTEILMDARQTEYRLENIIAMAAFYIIKDGWHIRPGAVFESLVAQYHPELPLRHLYFVPQYQWGPGMSEVELPDGTVFPLLAVPISDAELALLRESRPAVLEEKWGAEDIDVLDWTREGVV